MSATIFFNIMYIYIIFQEIIKKKSPELWYSGSKYSLKPAYMQNNIADTADMVHCDESEVHQNILKNYSQSFEGKLFSRRSSRQIELANSLLLLSTLNKICKKMQITDAVEKNEYLRQMYLILSTTLDSLSNPELLLASFGLQFDPELIQHNGEAVEQQLQRSQTCLGLLKVITIGALAGISVACGLFWEQLGR